MAATVPTVIQTPMKAITKTCSRIRTRMRAPSWWVGSTTATMTGRNASLYEMLRENRNSRPFALLPTKGASPTRSRSRGSSMHFWSSMAATPGVQLVSMMKSRHGSRSRGRIEERW